MYVHFLHSGQDHCSHWKFLSGCPKKGFSVNGSQLVDSKISRLEIMWLLFVGDNERWLFCEQSTIFARTEIKYFKKIFHCFKTRTFCPCVKKYYLQVQGMLRFSRLSCQDCFTKWSKLKCRGNMSYKLPVEEHLVSKKLPQLWHWNWRLKVHSEVLECISVDSWRWSFL
jgi:hypothetical protein